MSRPPAGRSALLATLGAVLGVLLLVAGCAGMPDSGPVVDAGVPAAADAQGASDIDPVPPRHDESATQVVNGFLEAMTASPIRTDVAREYLTASAAEAWDPRATITYASKAPPRDRGAQITVDLVDADRLDASGAWRGRVAAGAQVLHFRIVFEHGEFRIDNPPNALIVPETWFAQRFTAASLYFFDPTARTVVPQPVFVPTGTQLASALVDGLLAGPARSLRGVVRTYVPSQLSLSPSVTVSRDGVARISLAGNPGRLSTDTVRRMLVQFAWTLQQDPGIDGVTVTLNGLDVPLPDGARSFSADSQPAASADPDGYLSSTRLYGLRVGLLSSSYGDQFQPTTGPLGLTRHRLRSATVDLRGERVAAITSDGTTVLEAPTGTASGEDVGSGPPGPARTGPVRRPVTDAEDLLPPAWDVDQRLWLIDRHGGSAQVSWVSPNGVRHGVDVPGVTGLRVRSFLVSRDGTRLVAAVAGPDQDTLRIARIASDARGRVTGLSRAVAIPGTPSDPPRIRDLGWTSPTTVAVLAPLARRVFEIRTTRVDGSPTGPEDLATTVTGTVLSLATTPLPDKPDFAVTSAGLVDLATSELTPFVGEAPLVGVDYVG